MLSGGSEALVLYSGMGRRHHLSLIWCHLKTIAVHGTVAAIMGRRACKVAEGFLGDGNETGMVVNRMMG